MTWRQEPCGTVPRPQRSRLPIEGLRTVDDQTGRRQTAGPQTTGPSAFVAGPQENSLREEPRRPPPPLIHHASWWRGWTRQRWKGQKPRSGRCTPSTWRPIPRRVARDNPARSPPRQCESLCHQSRRLRRRPVEGALLDVANQEVPWGQKTECWTSPPWG